MLKDILKLMRPKHWVKNGFLLIAPIFAKVLHDPHYWPAISLCFASFSLTASAIYVINDLCDREADQHHPDKRHRPIASGRVDPLVAIGLAVLLFTIATLLALPLPDPYGGILLAYALLNLAYSWYLKNIVILDVMIVASGFVMRAVAGGLAIGVEISDWLILCTTMLSLFLAFTKRRQELVHMGESAGNHREALQVYTVPFLDQMISIATSSTVISYSLYTVSPATVAKFGTDGLKWTLPFVLFGIFRYLFLIHVRKGKGDPTNTLYQDGPLVINIMLWGATVFWILYTSRA